MFKVKGKVRPQLADLPGEAYEAVALQRCARVSASGRMLVYWSTDTVLTGHGQG